MGELPSDIRAILEALARKEITVDEAEALIDALRGAKSTKGQGDQSRNRRSRSVVGKQVTIAEDEEFVGDLEVVNGTVFVKGRIVGEFHAVFSDVFFTGEVTGNASFVGCKVRWNGGSIGGDLQLVGSQCSGARPHVKGNVNELNNFFVNGILGTVKLIVKPILSGVRAES